MRSGRRKQGPPLRTCGGSWGESGNVLCVEHLGVSEFRRLRPMSAPTVSTHTAHSSRCCSSATGPLNWRRPYAHVSPWSSVCKDSRR